MDGEADLEARTRRCGWRIALAITVQSAVVAVCFAAVFYVYYLVQQREPEGSYSKDIYIQFHPISVVDNDEKVEFQTYTGNLITLSEDKTQILVGCNGPHILHVEVCVSLLDQWDSQVDSRVDGTLTLRVNNQPKISFPLVLTRETCVRQQQIIYLHKREVATVYLNLTNLQVKLTLGLQYLLGQCMF